MGLAESAAAIVEGVLLARIRFSLRSTESGPAAVASSTLIAPEGEMAAVEVEVFGKVAPEEMGCDGFWESTAAASSRRGWCG